MLAAAQAGSDGTLLALTGVLTVILSGSAITALIAWLRFRKTGDAERDEIVARTTNLVLDSTERALKQEIAAREALEKQVAELHGRLRAIEKARDQAVNTAYQSLLQTIPDAIVQAGPDGRIQNINRVAQELFGYGDNGLIGQPLSMLMPERYRNDHRAGFERALRTGHGKLLDSNKATRLFALCADGSEFEIAIRLGMSEDTFTAVIRPWLTRNGEAAPS